jgi:hypothetical protein
VEAERDHAVEGEGGGALFSMFGSVKATLNSLSEFGKGVRG